MPGGEAYTLTEIFSPNFSQNNFVRIPHISVANECGWLIKVLENVYLENIRGYMGTIEITSGTR